MEQIEAPEEFLRDPSYWLLADNVEAWLDIVNKSLKPSEGLYLIEEIGFKVSDIKSWGVLDSVLRMMPRPQEILNQPERFIAYFISPTPQISNVARGSNQIQFDIDFSSVAYPHITSFLKAAFASLPCFKGELPAQCEWDQNRFIYRWSNEIQKSLLPVEDKSHRLSPDLMESIIAQLEKNQKDLEARNRELAQRNDQLLESQSELKATMAIKLFNEKMKGLSEFAEIISADLRQPVEQLSHEVQRMRDYMVRAQQVITLFGGVEKQNPLFGEVLRRVNWEQVKTSYPEILKRSEDSLELIRHLNRELQKGSLDILESTEKPEKKLKQQTTLDI